MQTCYTLMWMNYSHPLSKSRPHLSGTLHKMSVLNQIYSANTKNTKNNIHNMWSSIDYHRRFIHVNAIRRSTLPFIRRVTNNWIYCISQVSMFSFAMMTVREHHARQYAKFLMVQSALIVIWTAQSFLHNPNNFVTEISFCKLHNI